MSLFQSLTGATSNNSTPSTSIRAGKMTRAEGKMLKPDLRKGLIYVKNEASDGLLHFYWKDRKTNTVEDDLIIFPGEAKLERVTQSKDRVYLLKFENTSPRHFFWLQDLATDKDEELVKKINDTINGTGNESDDDAPGQPTREELLNFLRDNADGRVSEETANSLAQLLEMRGEISPDLEEFAAIVESLEDEEHEQFLTWAKDHVSPLFASSNLREALFYDAQGTEVEANLQRPQVKSTLLKICQGIRLGLLDGYVERNIPAELKTFLTQAKQQFGDAMQE